MSGDDNFLSRWSRLKRAARAGTPEPSAATPPPEAAPAAPAAAAPVLAEPVPLPSIESLTPQSDFTGFMKADVDPSLRTQALKTLFKDPHFNVMDGLDVYIDDYSKPDPIPEGWLEKMTQMARLGAYEPPKEPVEGAAPAREVAQPGPEASPAVPAPSDSTPADSPPPEGGVPESGTGHTA